MNYKETILNTNSIISGITAQEMVTVKCDVVSLEFMKMEDMKSTFHDLKDNITNKLSVLKNMFGSSLEITATIPKSMVKDYIKDVSKVIKNEDIDLSRLDRSIPSLVGVKIDANKVNSELKKAVTAINNTDGLIRKYDIALAKFISNKDIRKSFRDQFKDLKDITIANNTLNGNINAIMEKGKHKDSISIREYIGNIRSLLTVSEGFNELYQEIDFKRLNSIDDYIDSIDDSVKRLVDLSDDEISNVNLRSILDGLQEISDFITNISTTFYIIHQHFNMLRAINEELK